MSIALIFVLVWAAYGVLGPVVVQGPSARHNAIFVSMPKTGTNGNHLPAVRVQEVGEWRLCKIVGILAAMPGLVLSTDPVTQPIVTLLPMLLVDAASRSISGFDYAGHGAEIIAAERAGLMDYRAAEIERMRLFDNRQHMTPAQVDALLRRWHWLARVVHWMGSR